MTLRKQRYRRVHGLFRSSPLNELPEKQDEGWSWNLFLIGVVSLLIAGCSLTVSSDSANDTHLTNATDTVAVPTADEIWSALAQAVQAKTIDTTARLAQYVLFLARNGQLSDRDVSAFDAAFPQIAAGSRDLTNVDVRTLLELGHQVKR